MVIPEPKPIVEGELIETVGEESTALAVVEQSAPPPPTHLVATDPSEMKAAQGDLKTHLEQRLSVIEGEILELNAALNEARRNGWNTAALTAARNRAVDDETFYNKLLAAVEAGYTMIPDFPVDVFAVRRVKADSHQSNTWDGYVLPEGTYLNSPVQPDCAMVGQGEFRNPSPRLQSYYVGTAKNRQGQDVDRYRVTRTGEPAGPIVFPHFSARHRVMQAAAKAIEQKFFDQIAVCRPTVATAAGRTAQAASTRAGDPLIIGQVLRKRIGSAPQKCVSFIIAWHLNLNDL
jgi:hypothetical protein